jgi:hypothetical protein
MLKAGKFPDLISRFELPVELPKELLPIATL